MCAKCCVRKGCYTLSPRAASLSLCVRVRVRVGAWMRVCAHRRGAHAEGDDYAGKQTRQLLPAARCFLTCRCTTHTYSILHPTRFTFHAQCGLLPADTLVRMCTQTDTDRQRQTHCMILPAARCSWTGQCRRRTPAVVRVLLASRRSRATWARPDDRTSWTTF